MSNEQVVQSSSLACAFTEQKQPERLYSELLDSHHSLLITLETLCAELLVTLETSRSCR